MKTVILTEKRKKLILAFRTLTTTGFCRTKIGTEEWKRDLFAFLNAEDKRISFSRVKFWVDNHPWITAPETTETAEPDGASASVPLSMDDIKEKINRNYVGRYSTAGLGAPERRVMVRGQEPSREEHLDAEKQAELMALRLFRHVVSNETTQDDFYRFVKTQNGRRLSEICMATANIPEEPEAESDDDIVEVEVTEEEKATKKPDTSRKTTLRSSKALNTKN